MTKNNSPEQFQDMITFQPPPVKLIRDPEQIQLFYIPNYYIIIIALRKRPMTVRDLEQAFKEEAQKYEGIESKSDKSIYRYLKTLEHAGLVIPAGQRVVAGKMVTETLFARTAQIFLIFNIKPEYWLTKDGKHVATRIGKMMASAFQAKTPPVKPLQTLFMEYETKRQQILEDLATKGGQKIQELFASSSLEEHFRTEAYVGSFAPFIMEPTLLERLKELMQI